MKLLISIFSKLTIIAFLLLSNNGFAQNCPGLNVIGSFFDLSSNSFQNYATTQSNGQCYTLTPPYPAQVCFEYMIPFSDTVRATIHMQACGSLSSVGTGTYTAGCSGTASTNATFIGQSTYDANCNLIGNYIAAGYCSGAISGDILTVCFDLNTSSACDPITICPLLFCNTSLCSTSLPIELLSFEAVCIENKTILKWVTTSEINNDYFIIELSPDGINFNEIAYVEGAGNSNNTLYYSIIDDTNPYPTNYYRLKQIDFDGNYSYSNIIASKCNTTEFEVYPNPSTGVLNISLDDFNSSETTEVLVINSLGEIVMEKLIINPFTPLNINHLASGIYQIHLIKNNQVFVSKKIIKQ